MEFSTTSKKKKRKSRKCLDEIRKRSRLSIGENSEQHGKMIKPEVHAPSHKLITVNRLTLNMFPKAIRSETITRPLLEELKLKSNYRISHENIRSANSSKESDIECSERCNSLASNNSMPLFDLGESLLEHGRSPTDIPLEDSPNSHRPDLVNITETPAEAMPRIDSSSTTYLSSQTLDGDHRFELHEELMNEISSHLKKVTSTIIKEDIIKSTKINLQKLFTKSRSKEYQIDMLEHEKSNKLTETTQYPKNSIVQNPIDYIRLKQQVIYDDCHLDLSESISSLSSPALERDCSREITLYDTPEYNYYPHRLN